MFWQAFNNTLLPDNADKDNDDVNLNKRRQNTTDDNIM